MKRMISAALACAFFTVPGVADIVVIVNPDNAATLSEQTVQRIFLGKINEFSTGETPTVVNLPAGNATRTEFDQRVLNRSSAQVTATLAKLVFTGRAVMPTEAETDAAVIALVQQDKNAIGYIDSSSLTDDVKVVNLD